MEAPQPKPEAGPEARNPCRRVVSAPLLRVHQIGNQERAHVHFPLRFNSRAQAVGRHSIQGVCRPSSDAARAPRIRREPMRMKILHALAALALSGTALAQPLGTAFTYQGQLTESGQPATGLYDLQVCVFDSPANPVAITCAPEFDDVPVEVGVFALALDFGAAPFAGQQRFLELRVRPGASTGGYSILAPRQLIRPAPEALRANISSAAPWSGLTGVPAGFADGIDSNSGGTVTSITAGTGLSGGIITGSGSIGIANGGVSAAQIASGAIGTAQIATGAVTGPQLAANAVGSAALADNAVDTGAVQDLSITRAKIVAGAVGSSELAAGAVGTTQLRLNAVDTLQVRDLSITQAKIAAGAVGSEQINPAQVQVRITSTCVIGQYVRGINADGSVLCESVQAYLGINLITIVDDPANTVGSFSSIAIGVDGLPVISYHDETANSLKVARCNNIACTGATTINTVDDSANNVGSASSIAIGADGFPVISYFDATAGTLKVARCSNTACTGGALSATITTVDDPANFVGLGSSIAIGADGFPVISYRDISASALKVARCNNAACTGAATITTVDDPINLVAFDTSIAIGVDGWPVISYWDTTADALKVAHCNNAACTGAVTITTVDDQANEVGRDSSIAIGAFGFPVISYEDRTAGALKVARCNNAACTGAATITTIDDPANEVGRDSSIAIGANGWPVISYRDLTADALKVARCTNFACTGAATVTTVDDPVNEVGFYSSIAIGADGLPVISYFDETAGTLKVAKCSRMSCQ